MAEMTPEADAGTGLSGKPGARCEEWAVRETHSISVSDNRPFRLPATLS